MGGSHHPQTPTKRKEQPKVSERQAADGSPGRPSPRLQSRASPIPAVAGTRFSQSKKPFIAWQGWKSQQEVIQAMSQGPSPGQCWGAGWDPLPWERCRAGRLSPWEEGQGNLVRIDKGSHPLRRVGSHLTHQDLQSWPTYLGTKESW